MHRRAANLSPLLPQTKLICGISARHHAWQRQTLHFGHINGDKYSVLVCDNRGAGLSTKPWWYSTSEMARDLVEVMDHVGWTEARSTHVVGLSLGGMIAQELAMLIPERVSSLNLLHTAAKVEQSWSEIFAGYVSPFLRPPRTLDETLESNALAMFNHRWLTEPDDCATPKAGMPGVRMPPGGEYLMFDNNFQRYAAQEINKQRQTNYGAADQWALLGHCLAGQLHRKTDRQLVDMANRVGRERILVLHTKEDNMVPAFHGEKLMNVIQPGVALMNDGQGHVPKLERARWFNELLEVSFANGEELTKAERESPEK